MKKLSISLIFLLSFALAVSAQGGVNFSGYWELDKANSKLDERMAKAIEGQSLNVTQNETEVRVDIKTKRAEMPPPNGEARGQGGGMGGQGGGRGMGRGMGGGMMAAADGTLTYLIGKETTIQQEGPMGAMPITLSAKIEGGILNLSQLRTFNGQMGEITITSKEMWSLSSDGKTLTVKRETETPRGKMESQSIYLKGKEPADQAATPDPAVSKPAMPKSISGGVLNGKAISLPKPPYPAAAKAEGASGAVNVQITIDEEGNVISAKAVSGHQALRTVCEEAARAAKFLPTMLQGQPVKVMGVVVYNFTP